MISKGIRGAITVDENSKEALKDATLELLREMFEQNNIYYAQNLPPHPYLTRGCNAHSSQTTTPSPTEKCCRRGDNYCIDNISHIIFTTTNDLNAEFPAKFAREDMGLKNTAMMCFHELDVPNSLPLCLRILIVLNCEEDFKPQFVYLKGASNLRK